jgi:hypothetical protein
VDAALRDTYAVKRGEHALRDTYAVKRGERWNQG